MMNIDQILLEDALVESDGSTLVTEVMIQRSALMGSQIALYSWQL
jgi:hypothetical protein